MSQSSLSLSFTFRNLLTCFSIIVVPISYADAQSTEERIAIYHLSGAPINNPAAIHNSTPQIPVDSSQVIAQVQLLDRAQTEQVRIKRLMEGKPAAYEDKLIDAGSISGEVFDELNDPQSNGYRRYIFETRFGSSSIKTHNNSQRATGSGTRIEYRFDTLNYGDFDLQADLRSSKGTPVEYFLGEVANEQKSGGRITLRNTAFPITSNTFADTAIGDIYSETTDALGRNYRFSLGSSAIRGLSTRVFNQNNDIRIGFGNRGVLIGEPYPSFIATQGQQAWLGMSHLLGNKWLAGVQINQYRNIPADTTELGLTTALASENVTNFAASIGYGNFYNSEGDLKARLTVLGSKSTNVVDSTGNNSNALGGFFESTIKLGRYRHEFGAFITQPNLRFGEYASATDTRGAYWRVDHSTQNFNWVLGLDYEKNANLKQANANHNQRLTINLHTQYKIDRTSSIHAYSNFTRYRANQYFESSSPINDGSTNGGREGTNSSYLTVSYRKNITDWGQSSLVGIIHRNQTIVLNGIPATGEEIAWEHDWVTGKYETMRPALITSIGFARDSSESDTQTYPTLGISYRVWPNADWSLGGNLRYSSRTGNLSTSRGLSGTMYAEGLLAKQWRIGASISANQAKFESTKPANLTDNLASRSSDKSVYIYLRYEGASGNPYQTIGVKNHDSAGSGSIKGVVYFDSNRDQEKQNSEQGVAKVDVILDGRYHQTTDKDGNFEFQFVSSGEHRLQLHQESIPLPWGAHLGNTTPINVPLRGVTTIEIPVIRIVN